MEWQETIHNIIGSQEDIVWWQMAIRAFIIFFMTLIIIRLSNKRIFGKYSAFDIVLGIMLGSILSRAITGNAPFFATLLAAIILVSLHRLTAIGSFYFDDIGTLAKGNKYLLIKDGKYLMKNLSKKNLSKEDIMEAIRTKKGMLSINEVKEAYLERSGEISIIKKS